MFSSYRNESISKVVACLAKHLETIDSRCFSLSTDVVFSDLRKEFTEFYRVAVVGQLKEQEPAYYWIRLVKNKPVEEIARTLKKQFDIMSKLHKFLTGISCDKVYLSCARPVLLLPEFNVLITEECSGRLFNDYLFQKVPIFMAEEIIVHCYHVGAWLHSYHHFLRERDVSSEKLERCLSNFIDRYHYVPKIENQYLTSCHRDFSPRNIFVSIDRVEVIDFVAVEKGLPDEDIQFFCNYIRKARFNMLYSTGFKKKMIGAFLEGYGVGGRMT